MLASRWVLDKDNPNHMYTAKKAPYGLKQATRAWYDMLSSFLISQDFSKGSVDPTLFIHMEGKELLLWNTQCWRNPNCMRKKKEVVDAVTSNMYDDTILYLHSRPEPTICYSSCSPVQARPTEKHLNAVKRIFRYLKGTVHRGLWYPKDSSIALTAFADADHAGCQDTRRSTSGSMQLLGDRLVSWSSIR
ncbi:hypothetical protein Tco_0875224 [Tanacetum coccineum]|uniref:Reverse transcriptase Ty1/copia-type domain-containing protein n=1 Tax=Tanacetum coccineum TaxID=301880 RepID=A0ABQ5BSD5_9ASTR